MPGLVGIAGAYGVSTIILFWGVESEIILADLRLPLILAWAGAGLALVFIGALRERG